MIGSFDYVTVKAYFNSEILSSKVKNKANRVMNVYLNWNHCTSEDEQKYDLSVYFSFNNDKNL